MSIVPRQSYIERMERYLGKDTIIILTGQRRIGKSYILRLFRDKVSRDATANVIFIDKEKHEFDEIRTYRDLDAYIDARRDKSKTNFILVDEIQDIDEFEKSVCSYYQLTDSDDTLAKYIQFGGLPGLLKMGLDEQDAREYQQDVYHTVLLKDVIMRNQIRNV